MGHGLEAFIIERLHVAARHVGDEGGFAPSINTNEQALNFIVDAIEKSNLKPGKDIVICLDVAANELINEKGDYSIQSKNYTSVEDNINYYKKLTSSYPIKSIEDPFAEEDWESWKKITTEIGKNVQIGPYSIIGPNVDIGDDTIVQSHVSILANTVIGKGNKIYPFIQSKNENYDINELKKLLENL